MKPLLWFCLGKPLYCLLSILSDILNTRVQRIISTVTEFLHFVLLFRCTPLYTCCTAGCGTAGHPLRIHLQPIYPSPTPGEIANNLISNQLQLVG